MGIEIINEMSDDELRKEILEGMANKLNKLNRQQLLGYVVSERVAGYQDRLMEEAELRQPKSIFDLFNRDTD